MPLPLTMLILFGSAKLLGEIFVRLRLPAIVGEILAGAVVGPHALAWVAPNDTLQALSELGVMFLLFDAGLQLHASALMGVAGIAAVVAGAEVAVTFGLTWLAMEAWGASPPESLIVSAALVATSVGVTATVLASRGLLDRKTSRIILAAAVIDDVLGLIALAGASSIARGKINIAEIVLTTSLAAIFTIAMAKWGAPVARRILPQVSSRARADEAQFHIALALMFALAALAIFARVSAIVGAFLAGVALSEFSESRVRDLTRGVTELLTPFFLAGIGLKLDMTLFRSPKLIGLTALLVAVAIAGKVAGCLLGAARRGWRDGLAIGFGMIPRGEVTLVVAQVGISLAVIGSDLYAALVFVTVASALLTPPLLRLTRV